MKEFLISENIFNIDYPSIMIVSILTDDHFLFDHYLHAKYCELLLKTQLLISVTSEQFKNSFEIVFEHFALEKGTCNLEVNALAVWKF